MITPMSAFEERTGTERSETVRLIPADGELRLEVQTKINFASTMLTPMNALNLATTLDIWLLQREINGDAEARRVLDIRRGAQDRVNAEFGGSGE